MKSVTVAQMRALDARTIEEAGIPGSVLMENAGRGAAEAILEFAAGLAENHVRRFVLLAGKGNNGGDAYVAARFLAEMSDVPVVLHSVCPISDLKGDALFHAERLPENVEFSIEPPAFGLGDVVVDALLGTGSTGGLRPPIGEWVERLNAVELPVVAMDIPTGLDGDEGTVADSAVTADLTVTMGLPKKGMFLKKGPELCGALRIIDIGIPRSFVDDLESEIDVVAASDVRFLLGRKPRTSHKNSNGRVLVVGGSAEYPGAPILAAEAALRAGAGLVVLAVPESAGVTAPNLRSVVFKRIKDSGGGTFSKASIPELNKLAGAADSLVIGPGTTTSAALDPVLEALLLYDKPMVLDADALNLIAANPELITSITTPNVVLTPHPGEAGRLLKAFELPPLADPADSVARLAAAANIAAVSGCVTVLKGHRTITATSNGSMVVNTSGSPSLATAGSGDVLAGLIAAFIAGGTDPFEPAAAAVFIHGLAGELSPFGVCGTTADDVAELIPEAMRRISPFA